MPPFIRIFEFQKNFLTGDIYLKSIRFLLNGKLYKLKKIFMKPLPKEVLEAYDEIHIPFKQKLRKRLEAVIKQIEAFERRQIEQGIKTSLKDLIERIAKDKELMEELMDEKGRISVELIRYKFGLSDKEARIVKKVLKKFWKGG